MMFCTLQPMPIGYIPIPDGFYQISSNERMDNIENRIDRNINYYYSILIEYAKIPALVAFQERANMVVSLIFL